MGLAARASHVARPEVMLQGDKPLPAGASVVSSPNGTGNGAAAPQPTGVTLNLLKGGIVYADKVTGMHLE